MQVNSSGRFVRRSIFAIRVLRIEGKEHAVAEGLYDSATDKITAFRAWLILRDGTVKEYGKSSMVDAALVSDDLYNGIRRKLIVAKQDADVGSTFGWEVVTEEETRFNQFEHSFQIEAPVLSSRFVLTLPKDWTFESRILNHPQIQPIRMGESLVWEMKNLFPIVHEPLSPPIAGIAPRLVGSLFPPQGVSAAGESFRSWIDVSRWATGTYDPQVVLNQAMIEKVRTLTAGLQTELDRIAAIAHFVQGISYLSIQMGKEGGYRPHLASETFGKAYGDCKDKVNLMRALLKAISIDSHPLIIYSGYRDYVQEAWPSPTQFNHVIIAVKTREISQSSAAIQNEKLGALLLFDPTDPMITLGRLPGDQQGSFALLAAGESGGLLRVPTSRVEEDRTEQKLDIELTPVGDIKVHIREDMTGADGDAARAQLRGRSRDSYIRMIESWVAETATGPRIDSVEPTIDETAGHVALDVAFTAARYGKLSQGRLMVFNPIVVSRHQMVALTEPTRRLPIRLEPKVFTETVKVRLPAGFTIDEMPEAARIESPFGVYTTECTSESSILQCRRSFRLERAVIPAEQYEKVKEFFASIRNSEQAPVVLLKE